MEIGRMRADRKRQAIASHNSHYCQALTAFRRPDVLAAAFGRGEHCINECFPLVDGTLLAQRVRQIGKHVSQHFLLTLLLKATMHRFVVRILWGQRVPLAARVENPEHGFKGFARRDGLSARTAGGDILLRGVSPDPFPPLVA